ncbi:MAG: SUMF1/EgtB/PvdO family nonheme iron enzyme [Verrucomicrobiota bacterium]
MLKCVLTVLALLVGHVYLLKAEESAPAESSQKDGAKPAAVAVQPFTNSLGMKFLPLPDRPDRPVLMSTKETRVQDYQAFSRAMKRSWPQADFKQSETHPAVNVSWEDAKAFARWLTQQERESGLLPEGWRYRLPLSEEWSQAAGLPKPGQSGVYDEALYSHFPWAGDWPPPQKSGNYHPTLGVDSYPHTAPVGSFAPNAQGFYDLGGNVWEWCEDVYNQSPDYRVLRGASWRMRDPGDLLTATTIGNRPSLRLSVYGFRLVIELPEG